MHHPQLEGLLGPVMPGRAELDFPIVQFDLGRALRMPGACLLLALLRPGTLARHMDEKPALHSAASGAVEQVEFIVRDAVMHCAHQQIDLVASTLLVEQLEEVRLPIHHADQPRVGQLGGHLDAIAQSFDPTESLLLFDRDGARGSIVALGFGRRCVASSAQHAQRQALGGHGQPLAVGCPRREPYVEALR